MKEKLTEKEKKKLLKRYLKLSEELIEMHDSLNERQKETTKPENLTSDFSTLPVFIERKNKKIKKIEKQLGWI